MGNRLYLQKLNSAQLDAIEIEDNVLLTAIPGSGKTRTLTNKVLYEYCNDEYKKIIAITYTNRASEEMEERIISQIGYIPDNIWVGTIHKFCLDYILRKYSSYSEYLSKPFSILGEDDDKKLIDELMKKYKVDFKTRIDYSLSVNGTPNEKIYYDYVYEYYQIQRESRKINFNLILYESYLLLLNNQNIARNLSSMIKYLCVDEYQDTQELQYNILALIYKASKKFGLFFVGDPNQAIYVGLGGIVKSKFELEQLFNTTFSELTLNECYRSNQKIIDFYSQFALKKIDMLSITEKYNNPEIIINKSISKESLVSHISSIIRKSLSDGISENEICIIAPQWFFLYDISSKLRVELPNVKFDAPNVIPIKKDENSICYKLSKIILANYSFNNKNRIIFIIKEIKKQLNEEYGLNFDYSAYELLQFLFESETSDLIGTDYLQNSLYNFFNKIGIYDLFEQELIDFIEQTKFKIKLYEKYGIEDSRLSFEKSLRSKEGIVVSTIHGIKGDEFRVVIAFGLLNGYVPHWDSILNTHTDKEDSKKLLFVLCSRAKEKLFLFAEQGRKTDSGNDYIINNDLDNASIPL